MATNLAKLALTALGIYTSRKQDFAERRLDPGDGAAVFFTSPGAAAVAARVLGLLSASQEVGCREQRNTGIENPRVGGARAWRCAP